MKAVLLAAGRGRRLSSATAGRPKALLEFGGETLLKRHLRQLAALAVDEVVIVTGYESKQIEAEVNRAKAPIQVRLLLNSQYERGSALSVLAASEVLAGADCLLMDADVLCGPEMIARLIDCSAPNCLLYDRLAFDSGEEVKVVTDRQSRVLEFGKKITANRTVAGESIGFFKFAPAASRRMAEILRAQAAVEASTEYEPAIDALAKEMNIVAVSASGLPWIEIDFPEDLERARREVWPQLSRSAR